MSRYQTVNKDVKKKKKKKKETSSLYKFSGVCPSESRDY